MVATLQTSPPVPVYRSKLEQPRVSGPYVSRPALEQRLDRIVTVPLTIVAAPAGHGKTRTLVEWLIARNVCAAWLSLSERDGALMHFAAHLAAALDRADPGVAPDLYRRLEAPDRLEPRELGEVFGDSLFDLHRDLVLVLDDFHLADTGAVATFVAGLIAAAPARLHIVVSTRRPPSFPLARLRSMGQVHELNAADFRFSVEETAALLRMAAGHDVGAEEAARLHAAVGGWPAAVRLLAIGMGAGGRLGARDVLPTELGTQLLLDYLSEEVLARLTPLHRDLLLRASLPDRFNADLLAVLAGATGSGDVQPLELDALRRLDLYREVPGIDETWFVYHALFRETFRRQLVASLGTAGVGDLHRRCARWFDSQGLIREAVTHLVEAGDITAASALIETRIQTALSVEDWQTIDACLALIPEYEIEQRPELVAASAWVAYLSGRGGRLMSRLGQLRDLRARNLLDDTQSAELDLLDIATFILSNPHPAQTLAAAERVSERVPPSHRYQSGVAQMFLGLALGAVGRVEDGLDRLAAFSTQESSRIDAASIRGFFGRVLVLWQAGRIAACEQTAADMLELAHRHRLPVSIGWGHYFLGLAAHERGDVEMAARHFATVIAAADQVHFLCAREAFHRQILIYQGQGRSEEADRALARLRELVLAIEAPEHLTTCDSLAARLALVRGDLPTARRWASSSEPSVDAMEFVRTENPVMTQAMTLVAQETPESLRAAQGLLDEIGRRARAAHSWIGLIDVLALTAALRQSAGDEPGATAVLRESLALGAEERIVMRYTFLPVTLAPILRRLLREPDPPPHARQVLALIEAASAAQNRPRQLPAGAQALLPEPLTSREFEVLACLERRLTNDEIGQELFISPITARNHVRNICSKLGVSGRRTAISRAQELGLLG
jgi:LuxR family transcriptional regulator, maltose regulon positive regulatory protein